MVGPSAIGSENGIPISIISAPDFGKAFIIFWDVFKSGSPDVTKHIKAFSFLVSKSKNFFQFYFES